MGWDGVGWDGMGWDRMVGKAEQQHGHAVILVELSGGEGKKERPVLPAGGAMVKLDGVRHSP